KRNWLITEFSNQPSWCMFQPAPNDQNGATRLLLPNLDEPSARMVAFSKYLLAKEYLALMNALNILEATKLLEGLAFSAYPRANPMLVNRSFGNPMAVNDRSSKLSVRILVPATTLKLCWPIRLSQFSRILASQNNSSLL